MDSGTSPPGYFSKFPDTSESARRILSLLFDIVGTPRSLVDLGGGVGAWASTAKQLGVSRVFCVDHPDTSLAELLIDEDEFIPSDLAVSIPPPIRCDIALSLETAEHLPSCMSDKIVEFLTGSAPIVLFSAAIPGQPGFRHINEQPPRYWTALFARAGYDCWDIVRPRIIHDAGMPYWYRQNTYVFATQNMKPKLQSAHLPYMDLPEDFELVHQSILSRYRQSLQIPGFRRWLRLLPAMIRQKISSE